MAVLSSGWSGSVFDVQFSTLMTNFSGWWQMLGGSGRSSRAVSCSPERMQRLVLLFPARQTVMWCRDILKSYLAWGSVGYLQLERVEMPAGQLTEVFLEVGLKAAVGFVTYLGIQILCKMDISWKGKWTHSPFSMLLVHLYLCPLVILWLHCDACMSVPSGLTWKDSACPYLALIFGSRMVARLVPLTVSRVPPLRKKRNYLFIYFFWNTCCAKVIL